MNLVKFLSMLKTPNKTESSNQYHLTYQEIEILLNILKESTLKVKDIEPMYKILIKLQEQHKNDKSRT